MGKHRHKLKLTLSGPSFIPDAPRLMKPRRRRTSKKKLACLHRSLDRLMRSRERKSGIDEETQEISYGHCFTLDVASARSHGFSEKQIDRIFLAMKKIMDRELPIAQRRFPDRYKDEGGTTVFDGPCCVCDNGRKKEHLSSAVVEGARYCWACKTRWLRPGVAKRERVWL